MSETDKPEENGTEEERAIERVEGEGVVDGGELFESVPAQFRGQIQAFYSMMQSRSGPTMNPLFEKFNDSHIDKYLDGMLKDDSNIHELKKSNRWFYLFVFLVLMAIAVAGVVYLLPIDREILVQITGIIVSFAGGFGAGFGLSERRNR